MPCSPCEPNELKFGTWGLITNLAICGSDGLNLRKKPDINNPIVQPSRLTAIGARSFGPTATGDPDVI